MPALGRERQWRPIRRRDAGKPSGARAASREATDPLLLREVQLPSASEREKRKDVDPRPLTLQVLIGLSIVRNGLEALYDQARRDGNRREQMLVALALLDRERVYAWETGRTRQIALPGAVDLADPEARLTIDSTVMTMIEEALAQSTARRWKLEAVYQAQLAALRGDPGSARRASRLLKAASHDGGDPMTAAAARRTLTPKDAPQISEERFGAMSEQRRPRGEER